MSDEIQNAGSKGYLLLFSAVALFLFLYLVVSIYNANMDFVPTVVR